MDKPKIEEESPLMKDFRKWAQKITGIKSDKFKRIVYCCGDVGLVYFGLEINILDYLKEL